MLRGQTENGYRTSSLLPSNHFIHAISGKDYYGNLCVAFDRKVITSLRNNRMSLPGNAERGWDLRWGHFFDSQQYKVYATRKSYVQHQSGYSVLENRNGGLKTTTFIK